jgi:hypothetical protein
MQVEIISEALIKALDEQWIGEQAKLIA